MAKITKLEQRQMRLSTFCNAYDMPRSTVDLLIHSKGFPAYKVGGRWYNRCTKCKLYWNVSWYVLQKGYVCMECEVKNHEKA